MLRQLTVRDYAQVKSLDIELDQGLTVITGESGAGKSILFGALALVLGNRADNASIRPGASRAEVSAEFDLAGKPDAQQFLTERELGDSEFPERCLLRRTVAREGRSRAYINGTPVNLKDLEQFADGLIDIHGQNEHQLLLNRGVQLKLLDDFADASELAGSVREAYQAWHTAARELDRAERTLSESSDRRDLLAYQTRELDELSLAPEEYQSVDAQHRRLSQAADLQERIAAVLNALDSDSGPGRTALGEALGSILSIDDDHPSLSAAKELLITALDHVDDAAGELRDYLESLQIEPEQLARLDERLERINTLARKHRVRPQELATHHQGLHAELDGLSVSADDLAELRDQVDTFQANYRGLARELGDARRRACKDYESQVSAHMESLGIRGGALQVGFEDQESESGLESVDYLIVTNPKYPAGPLAKVASGGERARVSLAIQIVAAQHSQLPSLVLDEADVGIGGTTADTVGRLLRQLADHTQVLCVTHAPQVAALGQHHLNVAKSDAHDTEIVALNRERRVDELARMLGGQEVTAKTLEYAEELISAGAV